MGKWLLFITSALVIAVLLSSASVAYADKPEPFFWGMVHCSGYQVSELVVLRDKFDSWYGAQRNNVDWLGSYHARMNEFALSLGCNPLFTADGQLTLSYRIVAEWQERVFNWYTPQPQ